MTASFRRPRRVFAEGESGAHIRRRRGRESQRLGAKEPARSRPPGFIGVAAFQVRAHRFQLPTQLSRFPLPILPSDPFDLGLRCREHHSSNTAQMFDADNYAYATGCNLPCFVDLKQHDASCHRPGRAPDSPSLSKTRRSFYDATESFRRDSFGLAEKLKAFLRAKETEYGICLSQCWSQLQATMLGRQSVNSGDCAPIAAGPEFQGAHETEQTCPKIFSGAWLPAQYRHRRRKRVGACDPLRCRRNNTWRDEHNIRSSYAAARGME